VRGENSRLTSKDVLVSGVLGFLDWILHVPHEVPADQRMIKYRPFQRIKKIGRYTSSIPLSRAVLVTIISVYTRDKVAFRISLKTPHLGKAIYALPYLLRRGL
jgi:hypothetical protein